MGQVLSKKIFKNALQLLEEDESVMDQNVWFNDLSPSVSKYMLLEIEYSDIKSYRATTAEFAARGWITAMPFGELAYYFKVLHPSPTNQEVDQVVRFYLANDSWPD